MNGQVSRSWLEDWKLMHQEVEYFDFDKVDESKDYYLVQEVKTNEDDLDGVDVL